MELVSLNAFILLRRDEMENKLREEIAKVAFDLHQKRGLVHGSDMQDWLEAERIVMARHENPEKKESKKASKAATKKRK
jgi:Protein of unknown function (DUF2934)